MEIDKLTGGSYPSDQSGYEDFVQYVLERFKNERLLAIRANSIIHGLDTFVHDTGDLFDFGSVLIRFPFSSKTLTVSGSDLYPAVNKCRLRDGRFLAIQMPMSLTADRSIKVIEISAMNDSDYGVMIIASRIGNKIVFCNGITLTVV